MRDRETETETELERVRARGCICRETRDSIGQTYAGVESSKKLRTAGNRAVAELSHQLPERTEFSNIVRRGRSVRLQITCNLEFDMPRQSLRLKQWRSSMRPIWSINRLCLAMKMKKSSTRSLQRCLQTQEIHLCYEDSTPKSGVWNWILMGKCLYLMDPQQHLVYYSGNIFGLMAAYLTSTPSSPRAGAP